MAARRARGFWDWRQRVSRLACGRLLLEACDIGRLFGARAQAAMRARGWPPPRKRDCRPRRRAHRPALLDLQASRGWPASLSRARRSLTSARRDAFASSPRPCRTASRASGFRRQIGGMAGRASSGRRRRSISAAPGREPPRRRLAPAQVDIQVWQRSKRASDGFGFASAISLLKIGGEEDEARVRRAVLDVHKPSSASARLVRALCLRQTRHSKYFQGDDRSLARSAIRASTSRALGEAARFPTGRIVSFLLRAAAAHWRQLPHASVAAHIGQSRPPDVGVEPGRAVEGFVPPRSRAQRGRGRARSPPGAAGGADMDVPRALEQAPHSPSELSMDSMRFRSGRSRARLA